MQKFLLLFLFMGIYAANAKAQSALLNADAFEKMLKNDKTVQLGDVRTPDEFKSGHIEGAVNYDFYASDFAKKMAKLDKKRPVMVYCAAGGRSGSAAGQLKKMGFTKIYDLDGGMGAWREAGKKVIN